MEAKKLVFVSENNNNKFIDIDPGDGEFTVTWGRVGTAGTKTTYPESKYASYVREKLAKGYQDVTEYVAESKNETDFSALPPTVAALVKDLIKAARDRIAESYTISTSAVTQKQVDKAQELLDELNGLQSSQLDVQRINSLLKELYASLPRKMSDTRRFFLKEPNQQFFLELLQSEQSLLDTLKGQVAAPVASSDKFELSAFGLDIREATQAERDEIAKETDFVPGHKKIWRVTNSETEKAFNPKKLRTKLLYHGSKTGNYWSILTGGLKIRPKGVPTTGSMFGNAVYGADKAQKSIGYTSLSGSRWASGDSNYAYLCIFEFATGEKWKVLGSKGEKSYSYWMGSIDKNQLEREGKDSVFASAGNDLRMNEYMVYDSNQVTIRYIIRIEK